MQSLLQVPTRNQAAYGQKSWTPDSFREGVLGMVREGAAGCMIRSCTVSDWLALKWSFSHHQSFGFNQPRVYVLVVCSFHLEGWSASCKNNFNQFSRSVVSNSLQHHGLQNTRLPCPPPTPRVSSNSCPLSRWCHPTSTKNNLGMCVRSLFVSFRELGFWWFHYVAEL